MKKLKFFVIGFLPGLLLVFFILNKKGASCSGYLPNSRVIAETLSKEFKYSEEVKNAMTTYKIDEKFVKDSIITNGKVDFDRSQAQKKPCPNYILTYPEKNPSYEVSFEKCEEEVTVNGLKKLK
ncbi:hypothetical protein DBR39_00675 [Chryseobacterium sp. KBW03]|jgi:hypothetical protein|uniref:DUF4258 domain-containing protein n=1 Tax=unclassified Chryseobacterium TaxID=2593645 RepID=UPI000F59E512|nr:MULTISPECIES: DUF4258 domain-containing protein [unclassified Chryseobacterium]RQO42422.1 hypothetical protein DBR39_00675 [Chryseobacterium sp. KBW03]UKB78353.1 DUF4258 domain-containing protein [Chryseobacterium sp. MEBOG07]